MKIGLEEFLKDVTVPNIDVEYLTSGSILLDDFCNTDKEMFLGNLKQTLTALKYDAFIIKPMLLNNKPFTDLFGTNSTFWITKLESYLEANTLCMSCENMILQDLMRLDLPAVAASKYLSSIDRLIARLNDNVYKFKELDEVTGKELLKQRAVYLPDYDETMKLIDGLELLQETILSITGKGKSIEKKDIAKYLKDLGLSTDKNPNIRTNWKMVGSSLTGALILGVASGGNPIFAYIGSHISKGLFTRNGRAISSRGWHSLSSIITASERMVKILYKTKEVMSKLKSLENINIDTVDKEKEDTFITAGIVLKKSLKAYKELVVTIGRGLGSISLEKRDFIKGFKETIKPKDKETE